MILTRNTEQFIGLKIKIGISKIKMLNMVSELKMMHLIEQRKVFKCGLICKKTIKLPEFYRNNLFYFGLLLQSFFIFKNSIFANCK